MCSNQCRTVFSQVCGPVPVNAGSLATRTGAGARRSAEPAGTLDTSRPSRGPGARTHTRPGARTHTLPGARTHTRPGAWSYTASQKTSRVSAITYTSALHSLRDRDETLRTHTCSHTHTPPNPSHTQIHSLRGDETLRTHTHTPPNPTTHKVPPDSQTQSETEPHPHDKK